MRSDMNKVLTERPRAGGTYVKRKKTALKIRPEDLDDENETLDPDESVKTLPIHGSRVYRHNKKQLTDLIGPLYRFLESKVGQPWNKVWSEACQTLDRRSMSGNHVFEHLVDYVCTLTFMLGGKVHTFVEGSGVPTPVEKGYHRHNAGLYVHPLTGILCRAKMPRRFVYQPRVDPNIKDGPSKLERYTKLGGIWYLSTYTSYSKPPGFFGYFKDRKLDYTELTVSYEEKWDERMEYGEKVYFIPRRTKIAYLLRSKKRQLSKHELKELGVTNDAPPDKRNRRQLNKLRN